MTHPERIILIHALIGVAVESGGSIVDAYRTGSPQELDRMIRAFHLEVTHLLAQIDPGDSPTVDPRPDRSFPPWDSSELPF